ncbi:MAG: ATP-binding protein [Treponema sp.]|nr:ATP-binding protein [Treponema sp.]
MRSLIKKLWTFVTHVQVLSVFLAFTLMVALSYFYMSNIERSHLLKNVDNAFKSTQSFIHADLTEPETTLGVIAENIKRMILRNAASDTVHDYLLNTTEFLTTDQRLMTYATAVYGFFDVFDDLFMPGIDWTPPDDYDPAERPWFLAAVEADGKVSLTEPYIDVVHGTIILTFSRCIFDDSGKRLGIICLDITMNKIYEFAINTHVTEGSYGILFDKDLNVIAHPIPERFLGRNIAQMNDGEAIKEILIRDGSISERKVWDYDRNVSLGFFQRFDNGWYLAIIAYPDKYYQSIREILIFLSVVGFILAITLILFLLSVVYGRKKAEERTKLMLDALPLCASFWDRNFNAIDCNQEAMNLFGLSNKKEYQERFYELSPEYQPDGSLSSEKAKEYLTKAFEEGYCRFEWIHKNFKGELIPAEITIVRVKHRNENIVCGYTRDLREMNAAMAKIREADERTMIMLDSAPLSITMWNRDVKLIDFNYESARVVGIYTKEEYQEKFLQLTPELQEDGENSIEVFEKFIDTAFSEGRAHINWNHNTIKGETVPFDAKAVRLNLKGEPVVVVYCHDLRDLNDAISKMREADECRHAIFDTTPLGSFMIDNALRILECNQEILRLFDVSSKEEYIERFFDFSPEYQPDGTRSYEKSHELINRAFNEGYCRFEWMHRKLNGELIPCEIILVCVFFRNEKVVCGYTRDLRELKAIITKMREADECTQVMFDSTPLACFLIDNTIKVLECNQEIVRLFGLTGKEDFINNVYSLFPEYQPSGEITVDLVNKYINDAFEEGYCCFELNHIRPDGEIVPTEVSLVRVKFRGLYAVAGYIRDLREIKAMIAEMRRAEVAEESSKAKSDFLAKMSHEIRTPMNAILGITEIQLQDETLPLITKEALERIYNSGDLLLGIINDILDLSKIESGKFELSTAQYDIASLIHDTVKLNIIRYESKPIEFKLFISEDVPLILVGDELRIKQILNNLLSNAFKYTHEGQIELNLSCEPKRNSSGVSLIIRVSDTGQGMTSDQIKKLGDKFSRFNMEANRKTEGTGLGMNIARNLIQLMKGDLLIESTPGMGSVFTVRLPQDCSNSELIGKEIAENLMKLNLKNTVKMRNAQITQEFMPYGRVLVVDDVETNLYVARGLMAPYGISIDTALSGFEAIDKIRDKNDYDIIFMDHMMPRMDGIEATKNIRNLGYSNPIVALTANALAGQAEMFIQNGFDDFISKPIDIRQLNSVLNKMIRDKQPPSVLEEARKQRNTLYAAGKHNIAIEPQLAEYFVRDAKKTINVFESMCENKFRRIDDLNIFIINIHAMKSALANIGENDLSNKASELEQAGRDQNTGLILTSLPGFLKSLQDVIDKHKTEDDNTDDIDVVLNDSDYLFLREKLQLIESSCKSYNKKTAKEALTSLKEKKWTRSIKEKLSLIAEHLLHSEFDETANIANELLKENS